MTTDIISPSEIHSELKRIWDSFEGTNKIRASLFNLIFFTEKKPRLEYLKKVSENVIEKFPSRVIFLTKDTESKESYLNTRVSVLPSSEGESDIACDYIEMDFSIEHEERVPFVILPHIVPDLPIYVIWAEDPSKGSDLFNHLEHLATRIIFDSESIENLPKFASNLLKFSETTSSEIADLNWARIESWRQLLTSTFYTTERLDQLKKATQIQILYNSQETSFFCHTQIQAIYLQGWISTQLNWDLKKIETENGKMLFHYQRDQQTVTITLYPEKYENLKPGSILSVDIETEDQNHFSFGRDLEMFHQVNMRFSSLEKCDIPLRYIFSKDESGLSLVKEICHRGSSKHFLNLLNRLKDQKELSFCEH